MSSQIPTKASAAYKKSVNIANSARPMHDGVDTRCKLNSKAAHQLRKHNDKWSQKKAVELFMENYDLQCGLRGVQSSRAMDAYGWAVKTQESYNKVNMRHKEAGKAEREAQLLREKKKKEIEKRSNNTN
mgnify:FL=1|jgi:hypothetical protein